MCGREDLHVFCFCSSPVLSRENKTSEDMKTFLFFEKFARDKLMFRL